MNRAGPAPPPPPPPPGPEPSYQPPPRPVSPVGSRAPWWSWLQRRDVRWAATLCVTASLAVAVATTGRGDFSPARVAALTALAFLALADLLAGGLLVVRRWGEVFPVALVGTLAVLAPVFIPFATADDCGPPGRSACDTSAAVGWIVVGPPTYLVILGMLVAGRGLGSVVRRLHAQGHKEDKN